MLRVTNSTSLNVSTFSRFIQIVAKVHCTDVDPATLQTATSVTCSIHQKNPRSLENAQSCTCHQQTAAGQLPGRNQARIVLSHVLKGTINLPNVRNTHELFAPGVRSCRELYFGLQYMLIPCELFFLPVHQEWYFSNTLKSPAPLTADVICACETSLP